MQHTTSTVQIFYSLGPVNGKLNGNAARTFLLKSNLPTHHLREIWDKSDKDKDGQLTLEEFTTAINLVHQCRQGTNTAIANSVRSAFTLCSNVHELSLCKQPANTEHSQQLAAANCSHSQQLAATNWSSFSGNALKAGGHVPGPVNNEDWVVDLTSKNRYLAMFHRLDDNRSGSVPGAKVKQEFIKSGLPVSLLSKIWHLADITKTGSLTADEFCVAMYLIESAQLGKDPPLTLPVALIPPKYRHLLVKGAARELSESSGSSSLSIFSKPTFENKKLENYNKGEQELERRRIELLEKERSAQAKKNATLAAAQQLAKQNEELKARRMLEFQRQRTRSLEDAARKQKKQEQANQTEYRNKMETWAVQRKENLLGQLSRIQEITTGLRTRKLLLDKELADLEGRCVSYKGKLDNYRHEKHNSVLQIEKLKKYKDEILREVHSARKAVESSQSELSSITNDKLRLSQQLRTRRNPDEVMINILDDQEKTKQSIISLRSEHENTAGKIYFNQAEQEKFYILQQDILDRLTEKEDELKQKQRLLASLQKRKQEVDANDVELVRQKEAENAKKQTEKRQFDLNIKCIEESLKSSESQKEKDLAETKRIQEDRIQFEKFNEFLSHRSEEAERNIKNATIAAKLATEALDSHRDRLAKLVHLERQKRETETEQFYARARPFPRDKTPKKTPQLVKTDNLICLDTPPRPTQKSNYMLELSSVLSPPSSPKPRVDCPESVTCPESAADLFTPEVVDDMWGEQRTDKNSVNLVEDEEGENSVYINMDMLGVLNKPERGGAASYQTSDNGTEEHIYAQAGSILDPEPQQSPSEVLFEVEAIKDHIGNEKELSFTKGARLKVFEVRNDYYFGEFDNKTGIFPVKAVEKCEWIYSLIGSERVAEALYDFNSEVEGDLAFAAGELVTVTEELGEWYRGFIGNRSGIFPGNFVQIMEDEGLQPPPSSLLPSSDILPIETLQVIVQYHTADIILNPGDLVSALTQPDPEHNVYIQNAKGQRAWIKTSILNMKQEYPAPNTAPVGAERIPASLHCYSLFAYTAQSSDELTLKSNDIITITEQSDPSWWIGRLGNQVGVLPSNYVEQINDHKSWETVKSWNANLLAAEDERTRQEAIHELITTEKTYIDDLLLVIEVFYNPLCSVATECELSKVFVNWQQLILCNARLFRALYNTSDSSSFETVGAVFSDEIENLIGPYTMFCSSQREAMVTLQEKTSPMFKAKEAECAQSPKVGKLPLSTFLLKPMQRITKYPLLIKKILQHTKETHPDVQHLREALNKTEELLTAVNEAVRATNRLESLQRVFVKCLSDDLGERLILNSNTNCLGPRKLIHFGSLSKSKGGKEMFAVLFNDMLWLAKVDRGRYGNKPIDLDARDFDTIKFEQYREPFLLQNVCMTENIKTAESVSFSHNDKNYTFYCTSNKESELWTDLLSEGIRHATLMYHQSHHRDAIPDPTVSGQATVTIRVVEALELALPPDEKSTSIFTQAALNGHVQRTPVSSPKWDHSMYFMLRDVCSDKIIINVYKEKTYSPNLPLGKFDLSLAKLTKAGGTGPWNKRLILTEAPSGAVNVSISILHHGDR